MKVVLSRKGFDSASGGGPSPIVNGRPVSLPIPWDGQSETSYDDLKLGELVERATKGRMAGSDLCHLDPMFSEGRCAFGQTGAAQSHLDNQGVGVGDLFLFFGLFADPDTGDRHHRIFGYLRVEEVHRLGQTPSPSDQPKGFVHRHPHTIGRWDANNTLWLGRGCTANIASDPLRLTVPGGPVSHWQVPEWLKETGLSYHNDPARWVSSGRLNTVGRGQEFVFDLPESDPAKRWIAETLVAIED